MSDFKGTPGPWEVVDDHPQRSVLYIYSCDGDTHACVYTVDEYADYNANLIAAAPELLEACLRIQAQFRQAGIESKAGSLNPIEDNAAQIDAVILKALGR